MWHHGNNDADEEEDVDHDEDDEDDEDDLDGEGAEDQPPTEPPTEPQAEPQPLVDGRPATTSPPESDDWFAAQFRLQHEGTRIRDRY